MPNRSAVKRTTRLPPNSATQAGISDELRFISDLGRSLLFTVHPKKVASRVASAIQNGVGAEICAFVAELENIGVVSCAYDSKGELLTNFFAKGKFEKWLEFLPPQVGHCEENSDEFMLTEASHKVEYVSPLHINGVVKGAIVVGFARKQDFTESKGRLIEAVTQMSAMSINLSAHYETAINDSINRAKEEHRRFTEAVLDALPVSLYVVDRD